jgi:hypothetical protein
VIGELLVAKFRLWPESVVRITEILDKSIAALSREAALHNERSHMAANDLERKPPRNEKPQPLSGLIREVHRRKISLMVEPSYQSLSKVMA